MFLFSISLNFFLSCQNGPPDEQASFTKPSVEENIQQRIESGGALLTLDLSQAERLLNILAPSDEPDLPFRAFHLDSVHGESIVYKDERSPPMVSLKSLIWGKTEDLIFVHAQNELRQQFYIYQEDWIASPEFVDLLERVEFQDDRFLINVQQTTHRQLIAFHNKQFIDGPIYREFEDAVHLKDGTLILNLEIEDANQLVSFDGQGFEILEKGKRISRLSLTPDEKSYTYTITKDRDTFYGVGSELYTRPPIWKELGDAYAYLGVNNTGERVVVDYTPLPTYDKISSFNTFDNNQRLYFIGNSDNQFTVHQTNEMQGHVHSEPYLKAPALKIHPETQDLYWLGLQESGTHLGIIKSAELQTSKHFKSITLQAHVKHKQLPIAIGLTQNGMNHVLTGTSSGEGFEKIDRLQTMLNDTAILYIGMKSEKQHVIQENDIGDGFDKIHTLGLTTLSEKAFYHASSEDSHYLLYDKESSPPVSSISRIIQNKKDDIAWQSESSDLVHIGFNSKIGDGFDAINSFQFSSNDVLWYDAKKGGELFRSVAFQNVLGPFNSMSKPVFSSASQSLIYATRYGTEQGDKVNVTDSIYRNNDLESSKQYSINNDQTAGRWLSGTNLPKIQIFSDSDSFFYLAKQPNQIFVGMNKNTWGPFEEVKFLKRWSSREKIVFAAKKDDKWTAHVNEEAHTKVDDITSLDFTLDRKKLRYDVKVSSERFVYVGQERFQSIRYEQLSPRKNIHTFQGRQNDKWMLIVDYNASTPFKDLERTRFTPDSYGVEVIAKTETGKQLVRKLHERDFDYSKTFDTLSSTRYYHFPLEQYTAKKIVEAYTEDELEAIQEGSYTGPLWLKIMDKTDSTVPIDTLDEKNMFLSVSSSIARISNGYLFKQIDAKNNRFELHTVQNLRDLGQNNSTRPMILRLHDRPYTIKASHNKKNGVIHSDQFFSSLESPHTNYFTENGHFHAIGRGVDTDHFIVDHAHSDGFNAIQGLSYSTLDSDSESNRLVLLTYNQDKRNPWYELVLIDDSLSIEKLEGARTIESSHVRRRSTFQIKTPEVDWIRLASRDKSTVIWEGQSHRSFVSVHNERYDHISDSYRDEAGLLEFYMGHRDGLSSIYAKGGHDAWYTEISNVSHSNNGNPIYLAHQEYQYANQHERTEAHVTTFKNNRRLSRLIHGEQLGPWQDNIHSLHPNDQFEHNVYVGVRDGLAQIYTGKDPLYNQYDDIGWVHTSEATETESATPNSDNAKDLRAIPSTDIHFLARSGDKWIEVHNGIEGNTFDGLESLVLATDLPKSYTRLEHGARLLPEAYADANGKYFYRAKMGSKDAIVHQNQRSDAVEGLDQVWLYNDGELMAFRNETHDGAQVYAAGALSDIYWAISDPMYQPFSQNFNFIAILAAPEILDIDNKTWFDFEETTEVDQLISHKELSIAADDQTPYERVILLHNTEPTNAAWFAKPIEVSSGIPAFQLTHQDSTSIWINGQEGPDVDSINPNNAYWGSSLDESRYAVVKDHQYYVAGNSLKHGPFDDLSKLDLLNLGDSGSWIWTGRLGNTIALYVDDVLYDQAHSISTERNISNDQLTYRAQQAHSRKYRRGEERFDQMLTFKIPKSDSSELMLLQLQDAGLNWFEVNSIISEKSDIFYFLQHIVEPDTNLEKLRWLGGTVDQETATLSIKVYEHSLETQSEMKILQPLEPVGALADADDK